MLRVINFVCIIIILHSCYVHTQLTVNLYQRYKVANIKSPKMNALPWCKLCDRGYQ